ncbi:MAG TPA: hypothetical protein VEZ16_00240 [Microvirga sp.]|nr:hypothetical protein [Microvirga sp.]
MLAQGTIQPHSRAYRTCDNNTVTVSEIIARIRSDWPHRDTYSIAQSLRVHESIVANLLARMRDEGRL